jgi:hypothetical protein
MVVNFYGFYYWLKGKQQDHDIRIEPIAVQTAIILSFEPVVKAIKIYHHKKELQNRFAI